MLRKERQWWQALLVLGLITLAAGLAYLSRGFTSFAAAAARYALFVPVVFAAHFFGVAGGIAASLSLSTFLVPLGVGQALAAGANAFGLEMVAAIIALNLTGYFWGALAGEQGQQRRLYQELYELAQHVTLEPRATAMAVLDAALANIPAGGGMVLLTIDPEFHLRVLASRGLTGVEVKALERAFGRQETVVEWAITAKRGVILNRLDEDRRFTAAGTGLPQNLLAVPLTRGEEICGGIFLFDRQGWGDFVPADLEWLTRLADRASVALENARLYAVSVAVADENARYYRELKVYANELDRLVEERTEALAKALADLKATQADLLQTSRLAAVGELAGRVAHEILNPLTGVLGRVQGRLQPRTEESSQDPAKIMHAILETWRQQAEEPGGLASYLTAPSPTAPEMSCGEEDLRDLRRLIAIMGEADTRHGEDLAFIETQILRLVRLVESLRELGRRDRSVRRVDLGEAVHQAVEIMSAILRRARIELRLALPEDIPAVTADPDELVQVLTNLLRNAVQAIEAAGRDDGRIDITCDVTGERVRLSLTDNGTGIAAENLDRIFEAGFTTKPREQGTGLGLNISRRFMRECHGDVEIAETNPGRGTTFLVWFPLRAADEAAAGGEE